MLWAIKKLSNDRRTNEWSTKDREKLSREVKWEDRLGGQMGGVRHQWGRTRTRREGGERTEGFPEDRGCRRRCKSAVMGWKRSSGVHNATHTHCSHTYTHTHTHTHHARNSGGEVRPVCTRVCVCVWVCSQYVAVKSAWSRRGGSAGVFYAKKKKKTRSVL